MLAITQETTTMRTFSVTPIVYPPIITTLYALIETLQDQVVPEDDAVVTAAVAWLCHAGYVKFPNVSGDREKARAH